MLGCALVFIIGALLYPSYAPAHPDRFLSWNWSRSEMEYIFRRIGLTFTGWLQINLVEAVAIFRYRLWDIDLLIRRTLVYSALTLSLGLFYSGGVTLLQVIFLFTGGQSSSISSVLSPLATAVLFNPLRHRIQDFIDRRFYRIRYSAEQTLSSFAAMARQETDLNMLSVNLINVVHDTIHPESLSLWLMKEEATGTKKA